MMLLLAFYVFLALGVSFFCSLLEAVLLTLTESELRTSAQKGFAWAAKLERLKHDIDRPLIAILTLNTVAHTMGAAGAGAQYARTYGGGAEAIFAAFLTFMILVLSEILPKTLGARNARKLAPFAAWTLPLLMTALAPMVLALRLIARFIPGPAAGSEPRHREELLAIASLGHASGQIDQSEVSFMHNLLRLNGVRVSDIMTPRTVVSSIRLDVPEPFSLEALKDTPFSRLPVLDEDMGVVRGFVLRYAIILDQDPAMDPWGVVERHLRPLPAILESQTVDKAFHRLVSERLHILAVVDEFGTFNGLLTLEDVIETIFGFEIVDELDQIADLRAHARERAVEARRRWPM
ncbi:hypothetical protein A3711_07355 [Erythrobacter sp. HI00D59]|jgi:CBS domain containing-hemolysin-like protein|nr:hypothetical protein A3711_07355 [Erythrobacter sp. HI00D59]